MLQSALVIVAAIVAAGLAGVRGGVSTLIGGVAYMLPNLLFVLRLALDEGRAKAKTFYVGEAFKVAGTIGILVVAARFYEVHWLCMLVGLAVALQANLVALLLKT